MENEDNDERMITSEDNITDSISISNNNINNTYLSQKSPSIYYIQFFL